MLRYEGLGSEQGVGKGPAGQDLAATESLEPLGGSFAGFELRHVWRRGRKQTAYAVAFPSLARLAWAVDLDR